MALTPKIHCTASPVSASYTTKQIRIIRFASLCRRYGTKKNETHVNNESSEIIRMFFLEFDGLIPEHVRESAHPLGGFYPTNLRREVDDMNEWVYNTVNNGVYKCSFATTQDAYDSNLFPLFESLGRLEGHLGEAGHTRYLFGNGITEADIRLYTTLTRFDVAYYKIFSCSLKMMRHDYPRLNRWLRYFVSGWRTDDDRRCFQNDSGFLGGELTLTLLRNFC